MTYVEVFVPFVLAGYWLVLVVVCRANRVTSAEALLRATVVRAASRLRVALVANTEAFERAAGEARKFGDVFAAAQERER